MSNRDYNEWVPAGALVKGLFGLVTGIIVVVSVSLILFTNNLLMEDVMGLAFSWVILAFLLLVFWNFKGLRIKITDESLTLAYGLFNKKSFLLNDITSCKKTRAFGRYLGVGVRYGTDGSMAYTTSFSDAVEITPESGRTFVFSSKNPDKICEIISKGMSNSA
jgi:hypothetical protein